MLQNDQIRFLAKRADLDIYTQGGIITGVNNRQHRTSSIHYPYEEFKKGMGLDDIRFNWLLSDKAYMAGGSVLNWVWGENKNDDIDFFFTNADTSENFFRWISNYGFEETLNTKYARTMFNKDEGIIIQIVGNAENQNLADIFQEEWKFIAFDTPPNTIGRFDLEVCKFAVDGSSVYFTVGAVMDLLNMIINANITKSNTYERIIKYNRKGFYVPNIEEIIKDARRSDWF